jgi:hypothetical protein
MVWSVTQLETRPHLEGDITMVWSVTQLETRPHLEGDTAGMFIFGTTKTTTTILYTCVRVYHYNCNRNYNNNRHTHAQPHAHTHIHTHTHTHTHTHARTISTTSNSTSNSSISTSSNSIDSRKPPLVVSSTYFEPHNARQPNCIAQCHNCARTCYSMWCDRPRHMRITSTSDIACNVLSLILYIRDTGKQIG